MVRRFYLWIALILVILAGFAISTLKKDSVMEPTSEKEFKREEPLLVRAGIPYWDQEKALASFSQNIDKFDYVGFFWYYVGSNGDVVRYRNAKEDKNIIAIAQENNVKTVAVVTNLLDDEGLGWNRERVRNLINNGEARNSHIEKISQKIKNFGFDGVLVDYESLDERQKEDFIRFVEELSEKLHEDGKFVAVSLLPKSEKTKDKDGFGAIAQDWKEISKYADQLHIQAYSEHNNEGPAGPIASISWVEEIVNYALSLKIPREKLFLGIPLYGYKWQVDSDEDAEGLTFEQVQKIVKGNQIEILWDEEAKSPYFEYEKDGDTFEVWFENARSIDEKLKLADKAGFAGVNFWRLGDEDPAIWQKVAEIKSLFTQNK